MKKYKFTLHCLEKDFFGKSVFEQNGDSLEDAALRYLASYFNDDDYSKTGKVDDVNCVAYYGYVFQIGEAL